MVQVYRTLLIEVRKPWGITNGIQWNRKKKDIKCLDSKKIDHTYWKVPGVRSGKNKISEQTITLVMDAQKHRNWRSGWIAETHKILLMHLKRFWRIFDICCELEFGSARNVSEISKTILLGGSTDLELPWFSSELLRLIYPLACLIYIYHQDFTRCLSDGRLHY